MYRMYVVPSLAPSQPSMKMSYMQVVPSTLYLVPYTLYLSAKQCDIMNTCCILYPSPVNMQLSHMAGFCQLWNSNHHRLRFAMLTNFSVKPEPKYHLHGVVFCDPTPLWTIIIAGILRYTYAGKTGCIIVLAPFPNHFGNKARYAHLCTFTLQCAVLATVPVVPKPPWEWYMHLCWHCSVLCTPKPPWEWG